MSNHYKLTILTPAFNRASCLPKLYESLQNQTSKDFQWLVIDDGSMDGTKEVLQRFELSSHDFDYEFHVKGNGGKHTALNYSHPYIKGEWTCIVDSDDVLIPTAVEEILTAVDEYAPLRNVKVLTFLRGRGIASPLNTHFPSEPLISDHISFRVNGRRGGDCCEVVSTEVLKEHPFPEFEGEKFLGEGYLWNYTGFHYDTVYISRVIYLCEYLEGGLSMSGRSLRVRCPNGGMANCNSFFEKANGRNVSLRVLIKEGILFSCYGRFAGLSPAEIVQRCQRPWLASVCLIPGHILYLYWKYKYLKE